MRNGATRKGPDCKGIPGVLGTNRAAAAGMGLRVTVFAGLALWGCTAAPPEAEKPLTADAERGRLLYDTACVQCHTTQAHWREKRLVRTWPDLFHQVTRWQTLSGQNWRKEEVADVATYLNQRFYKLP